MSKQTWVEENLERLLVMLENKQEPNISIGAHCSSPFACDFVHHCWKHIPENSVFELYRGGNKAWELYEQGILKIEDIEDDFPLTHFQYLQRKGLRNQEQYINKEAIKNMISSWQFPLYFFDFETVFPAIPVLDGTRPYQQIPFQYSLNISRNLKPPSYRKKSSAFAGPRNPNRNCERRIKKNDFFNEKYIYIFVTIV